VLVVIVYVGRDADERYVGGTVVAESVEQSVLGQAVTGRPVARSAWAPDGAEVNLTAALVGLRVGEDASRVQLSPQLRRELARRQTEVYATVAQVHAVVDRRHVQTTLQHARHKHNAVIWCTPYSFTAAKIND